MTDTETIIPAHPATYSRKILDKLREMVAVEADRVGHVKVLDPFAGTGGVHELAEQRVETYGYEIQPEWAAAHKATVCGNVLELGSVFPAGTFDCIVTSPCYGNRMADSHDAKDPCKAPGCIGGAIDVGGQEPDGSGSICPRPCPACGGSGMSKRNTYAHYLRAAGVEPVGQENSALMQWGPGYRAFHLNAWSVVDRALRRDGLALINVKNHHRGKRLIRVVEFHLNAFLAMGYSLEGARRIETRGLAQGANHGSRTGFELILALRAPA